MIAMSFVIFLIFFLLVGIASAFSSKKNTEDYYLASRNVSPWLVGLSAVATNNSGYMFIGVIGYTYSSGLSAVWLMLGWILGDFLASIFVHVRLRQVALHHNQTSYIGAICAWANFKGNSFRILSAVISLIFLLAYAGAQMVAGGKALHVLLDWPQWLGALLGSGLVLIYCLAGGIRASIWTDAAQAIVMIVAMGVLLFAATTSIGGTDAVISRLSSIDGYIALTPNNTLISGLSGGLVFFIGWVVAGFSVVAQPQIMVRFMSMSNERGIIVARIWYYVWFLLFYSMATAVGMLSRIYLPSVQGFDAELALPTMALQLLPPAMVGLVLAGIFAATMSTADSLILSCSSFLTQDLFPNYFTRSVRIKTATIFVGLMALAWALLNKESVFSLVVLSWAMLGTIFVPIIIILSLGKKMQSNIVVLMTAISCTTLLLLHWCSLDNTIYSGLPTILVALTFYVITTKFINR